jgi:indole-3-pyruvate monooxygenase
MGGGFWELRTASDAYRARNLVVATGHTARPNMPDIPGLDDSPITVVHSSGYRNAVPYRGKRVLVVGFGNSAGEIARDLYEGGASPALAVRGPVNVVPREFFGVPLLSVTVPFSLAPAAVVDAMSAPLIFAARGTLKGTGLEKPPYGPFTQAQKYGRVPLIDTGIIPLMRQKRVPKMPGISWFSTTARASVSTRWFWPPASDRARKRCSRLSSASSTSRAYPELSAGRPPRRGSTSAASTSSLRGCCVRSPRRPA